MNTPAFRLFGGSVRSALTHAVTQYDIRQSRAKYYNHYALAQYLARIDDVEIDIAAGASVRAAIVAAFSDRLLHCALKAIGEPHQGINETQNVLYTPAAAKKGL